MKQENLILQDPKKKKDKDIEGNKGGAGVCNGSGSG